MLVIVMLLRVLGFTDRRQMWLSVRDGSWTRHKRNRDFRKKIVEFVVTVLGTPIWLRGGREHFRNCQTPVGSRCEGCLDFYHHWCTNDLERRAQIPSRDEIPDKACRYHRFGKKNHHIAKCTCVWVNDRYNPEWWKGCWECRESLRDYWTLKQKRLRFIRYCIRHPPLPFGPHWENPLPKSTDPPLKKIS
jgi:hypothetical protein